MKVQNFFDDGRRKFLKGSLAFGLGLLIPMGKVGHAVLTGLVIAIDGDKMITDESFWICNGCGICVRECPAGAISQYGSEGPIAYRGKRIFDVDKCQNHFSECKAICAVVCHRGSITRQGFD